MNWPGGTGSGRSAADLTIGVVLPDVLGTYGDIGNATVLAMRSGWGGVRAAVVRIEMDAPPPTSCDVYLVGGGEDTAQIAAVEWLRRFPALRSAMADTAHTLAVCAGLQILGTSMIDSHGREHPGLGLLDATSRPGRTRTVGEVVSRATLPGVGLLTGFANHRGVTELGPGTAPLGIVESGSGNDGPGSPEGAVSGRVLATYLHGPVLARNPALADHLLRAVAGDAFRGVPADRVPDLPDLRRAYLAERRSRWLPDLRLSIRRR